MKRLFPALLPLCVLLTWSACSNDDDDSDTSSFEIEAPNASLRIHYDDDPGVALAAQQAFDLLEKSVADAVPWSEAPKSIIWKISGAKPESFDSPFGADPMPGWGLGVKASQEGETLLIETYGADALGAQYAVYELLSRLGFFFYHPTDTHLPAQLDFAALDGLSVHETPTYEWRGQHMHTMHPVEMTPSLLVAGETQLERAKGYIDYLVANKQNYFQWFALRTSDFDSWIVHAQQIVDYAHLRGLKIGIDAPFVFRQQNALNLIEPESTDPLGDIRRNVARLMQADWDVINVEIGTTEFFDASDTGTMEWMNFLAQLLDEEYDAQELVKVHVSVEQTAPNFGDINFNFLPGLADPRVGVMPHTVQFYDLYGPAPTYDNENFHHIREFILEEIGERDVLYYPETAYWITFDADVPNYLPAYVKGRFNDLHNLADSGMTGQINFTSGLEWGLWLHDYTLMAYTWDAENYREPLDRYGRAMGESGSTIIDALEEYIEYQYDSLILQNRMKWLVAWDTADDIGHQVGIHSQPVRPRLWEVPEYDAAALDHFEEVELADLMTLEEELGFWADRFDELESNVDAIGLDFYREIQIGARVNALRATHLRLLYEGVVAWRRHELSGGQGRGEIGNAKFEENIEVRQEVLSLIADQETRMRWPDPAEIYGKDEIYECEDCREESAVVDLVTNGNLTSYPFSYMMTAHNGYYFDKVLVLSHFPPTSFRESDRLVIV